MNGQPARRLPVYKNTILMKKILIIILAAVLAIVSCSKEQRIVGSWQLTKFVNEGEVKDLSEIDLTMTLTFTDSGKLTSTYKWKGIQLSDDYTYAVDGDQLMIGSANVNYNISGKTLTIIGNGTLLGITGHVEMVFEKL